MVQRIQKKENKSSRNILPYFLESSLWKTHEVLYTENKSYWVTKDPVRARRMYEASLTGKRQGFTVQEFIYDMMDCLYKSDLAKATKDRIWFELDELEAYHEEMDTILELM